ncbi:MAG: DUF4148 domain-containing protein, partial [Limnohabitans sp.]
EMVAPGEAMCKLNELAPSMYPPKPVEVCKTREQVLKELRDAIPTGEMPATGETGCTLRELNPSAYPKAR